MLSPEAFNALLKTLEEPPPHVMFIMATTEHAKIPKTISSRCQDFDFRHLEDEKIITRLQLIAEAEKVSADLDVLTLITRQSEGCLRDAENLLERLVSSAGKNLTTDAVEQIIGLGSSALLRKLTTAITERDLSKSLKTLNDLTKQGTDLSQCLDQLIGYFRDLRLLAIDDNLSELIQSPKSDLPELKQKAEQMSVNRLSRIIKILMHTDRDIKQYGYPQIQLEAALIQLNSLEEGIPLQEIVDKLSTLEQKFDAAGISALPRQQLSPSEVNPSDQQTASPQTPRRTSKDILTSAEPDPVIHYTDSSTTTAPDSNAPNLSSTPQGSRDLADLPLFWEALKPKLPMKLRYGLLEGSVPTVNGTNIVKIACSPTHISMVTDADKQIITNILTQEVGTSVKIELVALDTVPESASAQDKAEKKERKTPMIRIAEARDDPQLKTALDLFDATVLETQ
jgi:DNA polymerase-3 subunit gamma/tau